MSQLRCIIWAVSERMNIYYLDHINSISKIDCYSISKIVWIFFYFLFFLSQNGTSAAHSVLLKRTSRTVLKRKNVRVLHTGP